MGIVKIERKLKRRRGKASRRRTTLKNESFMPVIKKVDVEELKASFTTKATKKAPKAKKEEVVAEVEETVETPAEETKSEE